MNRFTRDKLNLKPRSEQELHSALTDFELKWEDKARRSLRNDRVSRF